MTVASWSPDDFDEGRDRPEADELFASIYAELHAIAKRAMAGERQGHTLQTSDLLHTAYARVRHYIHHANDRNHVFALMRRAMRRVLLDYGDGRRAQKRTPPPAEEAPTVSPFADDVLDLAHTLDAFSRVHPRACAVAEYRYYYGFTMREVARLLSISEATVYNDWTFARAWLRERLG